jgi:stage II sporulation protein D
MKYLCLLAGVVSLFAQNYKVQTPAGVIEMTPEDYVAGVVTGESGDFKSTEALKAMAVAARTYAARMRGRHAGAGFDFCSTTHCQRFVIASGRSATAARDTAGQILWFEGKPAFSVYSRSCGGKTEMVAAVWPDINAPYLTSHADPYCSRPWTWIGSADEIRHALLQAGLQSPPQLKSITVVRTTSSGRAQLLSLDGKLMSASSFRFALGRSIGWNTLRSELYTIENTGNRILFRGSGEGHGVGLCQLGADEMGRQGSSYREILAFYYPGTTLSVNARDLHWTRVGGEGIVLYTLLPDSDRALMDAAEAIVQQWRGRLPWPLPASIDIYVYPDLDAFRNATAEPGWVAARTNANKIEMQPSAVLRSHHALQSTLQHELLHCFVEAAARSGLPVWFREGLVEHLAGAPPAQAAAGSEDALRQRSDRTAAEDGYRGAQARVEVLINRYGETAVLGWVTRGLPADVKYSAASSPAVKSK